MVRAERAKREVLAVARKCWCSLLAACSPWLLGQAVSHIELELGCISLEIFDLWTRVGRYIKGSG